MIVIEPDGVAYNNCGNGVKAVFLPGALDPAGSLAQEFLSRKIYRG